MKKLFFYLSVAMLAVAAVSCQKEMVVADGEDGNVTLTIQTPEVGTKAIANGENVDIVYYEVYKKESIDGGAPLIDSWIEDFDGTATLKLNLLQNQNYVILFWAEVAGKNFYDTDDLRKVTVDYTGLTANNEDRAAFCQVFELSTSQVTSATVTLVRPFAQINLGTTLQSIDPVFNGYALDLESSYMEVVGAATTFNVATMKTGSETTTAKFGDYTVPHDFDPQEVLTVNNVNYAYLGMNYILAANDKATVDVQYKVITNVGSLSRNIPAVPVQKNHRTNILGNLLTQETAIEIVVDERFADEELDGGKFGVIDGQYYVKAETSAEFYDAVADEDVDIVILTGDVVLNAPVTRSDVVNALTVSEGEALTIDLAGHTLSWTSANPGDAMIKNNGELKLVGEGKVVYIYTGEGDSTNSKGNYTIVNNNKLTIDGPTVENATAKMSHAFYAVHNAGDLHIKSGKVLNTNNYAIRLWIGASKATSVVMDDGVVEGTRAFWAQLPSSSADAPVHDFTMNGGKLIGTGEKDYKLALYSYNYGNSLENVSFTFNGGEVEGDIALTGGKNKENIETLNINGGTFNGEVYSYGDTEKAAEAITIKGGVICGLDVLDYVKSQGESVEVKLTEDVELTSGYKFENEVASITIDGNGKTIKVMKADTGRVIDFTSATNGANLTLKNLTIENNISWVERIVNYNTCGTLTLENVKITNAKGCSSNYAVNLPASSDKANVVINNSEIWAGANALNLWGAETVANITDSKLYVVDANAVEGYSVVSLNNQGENAAHNSTINVVGGEVKVVYEGEGETMPSSAFRDATVGSVINISETTVVVGEIKIPVANVLYEGYDQFYSFTTLQAAIDKVQADNNGTVCLIKNLVLTEKVNVKADDFPVVIDLNGYNLHMVDETEVGFEMINNAGNLTIMGEGKLSVEATINSGWNRRSSVISNVPGGNLTINEGVVVEHLGGTDMAYGIDNLTNGKGTYAVTTINGATIKSTYSAIRQFLNGIEATNELYVMDGSTLVSPNRSIFFQDPSKNANTGKLVVEAGASLTGDVRLSVTEGSTEWPVEVSVAEAALANGSQVTYNYVPEGYEVVNVNGIWTVVKK